MKKDEKKAQVKALESILEKVVSLFDELTAYEGKYQVNMRDWHSMEQHFVLGVKRIYKLYENKKGIFDEIQKKKEKEIRH